MNFFDLIRALAALSLTLGLLIGAAWLARRYGLMQGQLPSLAKGRLKLVEQIWLDAGRTRAIVLRYNETEHLLIVTPTGATALSSTPIPQDPAHPSETDLTLGTRP